MLVHDCIDENHAYFVLVGGYVKLLWFLLINVLIFSVLLILSLQFFMTEPYACEPSSLPQYPPTKEIDAKRRDDEARRYGSCRLFEA